MASGARNWSRTSDCERIKFLSRWRCGRHRRLCHWGRGCWGWSCCGLRWGSGLGNLQNSAAFRALGILSCSLVTNTQNLLTLGALKLDRHVSSFSNGSLQIAKAKLGDPRRSELLSTRVLAAKFKSNSFVTSRGPVCTQIINENFDIYHPPIFDPADNHSMRTVVL